MQATIHNEFLTLTVDTNVRLAAGATIELWAFRPEQTHRNRFRQNFR